MSAIPDEAARVGTPPSAAPPTIEDTLAALGWRAVDDASTLRLEGVGTSQHYLGRAWSPTGAYRALPAEDGLYVLLGIEGRAIVTYDNTALDVPRDHLTFLNSEADVDVQLTSATARYLWKLTPSFLSRSVVRERLGEPVPVTPDVWQTIASLTNSALNAPAPVTSSRHFGQAAESLLAAVLEDARRLSPVLPTTRPDQVFGEAMAVIDATFRDVNCAPGSIASALLVSERTLRRAFAAMGTTPRAEIERRRVTELRQSLTRHGASLPFATACEMSGFRNARQAKDAARRQ